MDANLDLAEKAVALEWQMFDAVNKGLTRAECQDDYETFHAMRTAQFHAWPQDVTDAYLSDLMLASQGGRNLIAEKYIHMMKTAQPREYAELISTIPAPSECATLLAQKITDTLVAQTHLLFEKYPNVSGAGRPLYAISDNACVTSVETYQLSELLTYSESTLAALSGYITALDETGDSLAQRILENTVSFYGYNSLEAAEAAAAKLNNRVRDGFGCGECVECSL